MAFADYCRHKDIILYGKIFELNSDEFFLIPDYEFKSFYAVINYAAKGFYFVLAVRILYRTDIGTYAFGGYQLRRNNAFDSACFNNFREGKMMNRTRSAVKNFPNLFRKLQSSAQTQRKRTSSSKKELWISTALSR